MKSLEQNIAKFINRESLIENGDRVLAAFSGGPDSVFLLHFLHKNLKRFGIELFACHVNHNLRGKDSETDELFCKKICDELGVKFFKASVDVKSFAKTKKISLEEAARDLRYSELNRISGENKFTKIAAAHNKDDNAETVLLNLFKGTGLTGLSGIPIKRDNIIRPLLCVNKTEILEYLKENGIEFRIDKSNLRNDFQRNFIRNKIIPQIRKEINPSLNDALFNSSGIIKNSDAVLKGYIETISKKYVKYSPGVLEINLKLIEDAGEEILGETLKYNIDKYFDCSFEYNDLLKLKDLTKNQTGKRVILNKNVEAFKERGSLVFIKPNAAIENSESILKVGHQVLFAGQTIGIEKAENISISDFNTEHSLEYICGDDLDEEFIIRRWRNGDKFKPLGMDNFKKVSDFLNEQHVPAFQKKNQLLLTNRNNIVWIIGLRIDNRIKYSDKCRRVYKLWMK
jgi:tRNA(Ile)-lysidine synthase